MQLAWKRELGESLGMSNSFLSQAIYTTHGTLLRCIPHYLGNKANEEAAVQLDDLHGPYAGALHVDWVDAIWMMLF